MRCEFNADAGPRDINIVGDTRLEVLRNNGVANTNETLKAYEIAQARLNDAVSFDRDTDRYVDAISSAARLQKNIQTRIDEFVSAFLIPSFLPGPKPHGPLASTALALTVFAGMR